MQWILAGMITAMPLLAYAEADFNTRIQQVAPPVPSGVKAAFKNATVTVQWNNVTPSDITEFRLFRLENYSPDATLKQIATIPRYANSPSVFVYGDNTIQPGHQYSYFLTSKDRFGVQSDNSKMVRVDKLPDKFRH